MSAFVNGAIWMACVAIGAFFLRFWKNTADRLFAMFAVSFWLLALDRMIHLAAGLAIISLPVQYIARLVAFILIIAGIVEKNRKS